MAYPRYNYLNKRLYLMIDRVTVDTNLNLIDKINLFHGLSQTNSEQKEYRTVRIAVDEETQFMAICAQIIKLDAQLTRVLMVSLELNRDRNK